MGTTPIRDEPERLVQARERLATTASVIVTGQPYGQTRRTLLLLVIAVCLVIAPGNPPASVFGLVALLLLALEGKR